MKSIQLVRNKRVVLGALLLGTLSITPTITPQITSANQQEKLSPEEIELLRYFVSAFERKDLPWTVFCDDTITRINAVKNSRYNKLKEILASVRSKRSAIMIMPALKPLKDSTTLPINECPQDIQNRYNSITMAQITAWISNAVKL